MARTLQEILAPGVISRIIRQAPVHRLENVGGDPHKVRTACGRYQFHSMRDRLICDADRVGTVTCPECLAAMVDCEPAVIVLEG